MLPRYGLPSSAKALRRYIKPRWFLA
jgi:hypothetical protein